MSRVLKALLFLFAGVFVLACNLVTRPINQAQEAVETVQSLATAIPIETLQAFPSAMPDIEMPTGMPDLGNVTNPQDEPLTEWNGIPVFPSATTGGESSGMYSYKAAAEATEVVDYYKSVMIKLGWNELFGIPDTGSGALLNYDKDGQAAIITITTTGEGEVLVFLVNQ